MPFITEKIAVLDMLMKANTELITARVSERIMRRKNLIGKANDKEMAQMGAMQQRVRDLEGMENDLQELLKTASDQNPLAVELQKQYPEVTPEKGQEPAA